MGEAGAVFIALGIISLVYALSFEASGLAKQLGIIAGMREEENTFTAKLGGWFAKYMPDAANLLRFRLKDELELIALSGSTWTAETIYGLLLLFAVGGAVLGWLSFGVMGLLGFVVGPFVVFEVIKGKANKVRRQIRRELPDVINIMAVELASGASITQALESASTSPTLVGQWLKAIVAGKKLTEEAEKLGMAELISFAYNVESVSRMGIGGAEALSGLAKETTRRYLNEVNAKVAKLESELAVPSVLFFFLPFVFLLLALTGISLVSSGIFGG